MGRIFSVMATLVGLVSIAVLLGNLTTSLTTDIVFSDIKLYGSKVITINLVFFFPKLEKTICRQVWNFCVETFCKI